ncbi:16S rRNA (uracil(1498)-N(3))-methyltransferase [Dokdonia sinensis]|uniref:Ribosomal RNA small subunit methyltransferase E n=1 Tax=Dokdonia sinensis TaxID=2479847 RepID=A0A3M0GUG9_9FLAO|nr:16S rRNA (uracil(1498)-N(3))-methyltransferase [Dokdonia sinensis]RMB60966.1 16S rRNA (uracil(1498)-N(3))-methyltransferase [Dokdonia sinensis]
MQLFYNSDIELLTKTYSFPRDESKHIVRVLRKQEGDTLHITNGKGYIFKGTITAAGQNKCIIEIKSFEQQAPLPYYLHLAVAPTKSNDRFEWFLEKATEIGISEITPLLCDHSERKVIKQERFEKIIQSAMKQSLQAHLPKLNPLASFKDFINDASCEHKFIAHCEPTKKNKLSHSAALKKKVLVLIGPEGDFSPEEISSAAENKYIAVTLGSQRLRTETAAITACQLISFLNDN